MFRSFLLVAVRRLMKHKGYSLINIFGLAVGIACCVMILLYVQDELSYDAFHAGADRVVRIVKDFVNDDGSRVPDATTPPALVPTLAKELPEIESATRIFPPWGYKPLISHGDQSFYEGNFLRVDSSFFDVFSYEFARGDRRTALLEPLSMVITESFARKYFGDDDPVGRSLTFDGGSALKVTGVLRDPPHQSHLKFDFLLPIRSLSRTGDFMMDANWGWYNFYSYAKLKENTTRAAVEPKIQTIFKAHQPENSNIYYTQQLAGINGIHLASHLKWELEPNSDNTTIYVFLTVAMFIVAIAGMNYVNLTTARSATRAKEVGMRKVVGAFRRDLVLQFLTESVLLSLLASFLSIGLAEISLPLFNGITQKDLSFLGTHAGSVLLLVFGIGLTLGVVAGLYPALSLSGHRTMGTTQPRVRRFLDLRKGLVVFQFVMSVTLLIGIMVVQRQMNFIQSAKLGFNKDQVLIIRNVGLLPGRGEAVRAALARVPGVKGVSPCDGMIGGQNWTNTVRAKDSRNGLLLNFLSVGYDFLDVMEATLKEGRNFSPAFPSDSIDGIILNETAVRLLGIKEPAVGQQIVWDESPDTTVYVKVAGVVHDFHFASFREEIKPFAFIFAPSRTWLFAAKISSRDVRTTLAEMESTWNGNVPNRPIDYYFLDESIDKLYRSERNFRTVFSIMTGLSVAIACLGLFGLAAYTAEQRTKEIGVRKVLGASVRGIVGLLSKEFLLLVGFSTLVSWPIAWYVMARWLQSFAYRISLDVTLFLFASVLALLIALLTVSIQALRAAFTNPVDALRYE